MKYTITNDTVTVFLKGEPHAVTKGTPNYLALRAAVLNENWDAVPDLLTVEKAVETWLQGGSPDKATKASAKTMGDKDFTVRDGKVHYKGESLPEGLNDRIIQMTAKNENPQLLLNFWRRLKRNPNPNSVKQLFGFLKHSGIPIQDDGTFLAYKGVQMNFRDVHSGHFDNSPGKTIKMNRAQVSDDPSTACHSGLHVGALDYARTFGKNVVIVRVDPENVVCVPNDHNAQKMRTCEYTVVGLYGGQMPDTSFTADTAVKVDVSTPLDEDGGEGYEALTENPPLPLKGTLWDHLNSMDAAQLLEQPISDLRKYATYNCKITGSSKMPGGKEALVARIIEVRSVPKVEAVVEPPKVEAVVETPPTPAGIEGVKLPLTGTDWDFFNDLNTLELMAQSLDDLRKYARFNCLIVGASKMGGGKVTLITRIAEIRGDE